MTSSVQCVAFNNSENWLGAGSRSGVVKVFDLEENRGKPQGAGCLALYHLGVVCGTTPSCTLTFGQSLLL